MNRFTIVSIAFMIFMGVAWMSTVEKLSPATAAEQDKVQTPQAKPLEKNIRKQTPVQVFMQAKLKDNSTILEGLMTNQFGKIIEAAEHLDLMSTATAWHVIQGPIYKQHSAEFRRSAEELKKAAKKKNLDGAALAYMHMTMTCINCHKFVRGTRLAQGRPGHDEIDVFAGKLLPSSIKPAR